MNSKLYVGNLSFKTTESDLRNAFGPFGSVTDVYIANDRETGRPRGFAFVTFSTDTESKLAAEKMNGADLDGRPLTVNEAKPKEAMGGSRRY
jgi:cold-inducible RNA-binding protein